MEGNIVIKTICEVIGNSRRDFMCGEYTVEQDKVGIKRETRGGVYGIAVKLNEGEDPQEFYDKIFKGGNAYDLTKKKRKWETIGEGYYPLYWGKDINLGFRLYEHATGAESSASARLAARGLYGHSVIYGAVFCENKEKCEGDLREKYPDILKSYKIKK